MTEPGERRRAHAQRLAEAWALSLSVPPSPARAATRTLAAEGRRLAAVLCRTDASVAALEAEVEVLRGIVERLGVHGVRSERDAFLSPAESEAMRAELIADPTKTAALIAGNSHRETSPFVGASNPLSPPMHLEVLGDRVLATAWFDVQFEGPPGYVHGGVVAAAFDEMLGVTQGLSGRPGMTGRLTIDYRRPHPLRTEIRFESELVSVEGRKIFVSGRSYDGETLLAEAEGLFVSLDPARFFARAGEPAGAAGPPPA